MSFVPMPYSPVTNFETEDSLTVHLVVNIYVDWCILEESLSRIIKGNLTLK